MNASIVDLRYKMSEVPDALARRERVTIFYHGKVKFYRPSLPKRKSLIIKII